jgi:N-methylhydantoinase A
MRYLGQNYELDVDVPERELDAGGWKELLRRFAAAHRDHYGFELEGEPIELINLRAMATLEEEAPVLAEGTQHAAKTRQRAVYMGTPRPIACPILDRAELREGSALQGPAIIQEPDSTTLVWPGDQLRVLAGGALALTLKDVV